jgi:hypothetical protein
MDRNPMSGAVDFTLILLSAQKAQNASEAALGVVTNLRSEHGGRLDSIEARMLGVEGRLTALSAGQDSLHRAVLRIADRQIEHAATLAEHTASLARIETTLAAILAKLP